MKKKIIIGITGASGAIYGIRLLEILSKYQNIESHLILSNWAKETIGIETNYSIEKVLSLAKYIYPEENMSASISSGSFNPDGMVIVPGSMKTISAISCGFTSNLIIRCADVCLKERKRLIIVPRETPLNSIHLKNLLELSRLGVTILPPMPGFYFHPKSINEIIDHTIGKILDNLGISNNLFERWGGVNK